MPSNRTADLLSEKAGLGLILFIDHGSGKVNTVWVFGLGQIITGMLKVLVSFGIKFSDIKIR